MKLRPLVVSLITLAAGWQVVAHLPICRADTLAESPTSTHALWEQARSHLKASAYRDALRVLEELLRLDPGDPTARAYRALCQRRLKETDTLLRFSPADFATLQERLRQEQRAQAEEAARAQVIEREIAREQARWDAEMKQLQRETMHAHKARQRPATPPSAPLTTPAGAPVTTPSAPPSVGPSPLAPPPLTGRGGPSFKEMVLRPEGETETARD